MVSLSKNNIAKITHYNLTGTISDSIERNADLLILSDLKDVNKEKYNFVNIQKTYVTDLSSYVSIEDVKTKMSSTIRNSINFCENHSVLIEFFDKKIDLAIFKDFIKCLKMMYKQKHFKSKIVSIKTLIKYSKNDSLLISRSVFNNTPVSYHVYLKDNSECVLWFSCSLFRGSESSLDKNFVGKCNRYHHYKDICYFFANHYLSFDWGGVSSFDNPNGIDTFKFSFPGIKTTKYEVLLPLTFKGKLYMRLKGLL